MTNGDFEGDGGWTIPITPYRARYTRDASYVGDRSLQLGIADPAADRWSYSSAEQRVAVPAGRRAKLRFWYHMPQSGGAGDYGYFMLRPDGGSWRVIRIVRDSTSDWTPLEVDVSHYGGQVFALRFGARNDGLRDGVTAVLYVDRVSVEACLP